MSIISIRPYEIVLNASLGRDNGNYQEGETYDIGNISADEIDSYMKQWENEIRNLEVEYAYTVDKDGNVFLSKGNGKGVNPKGINFDGATVLHNHPSDKYGEGWSFSEDDYRFLQSNPNVKELRLVTQSYNYSVNVKKLLNLSWTQAHKMA